MSQGLVLVWIRLVTPSFCFLSCDMTLMCGLSGVKHYFSIASVWRSNVRESLVSVCY